MSTKITGQPPPPRDIREPPKVDAKKTNTHGAQVAASVSMEALAKRVKGGKAVAGASLLTSHADDPDPLALQVKQGLVSGRWAVQGLLDEEAHDDSSQHEPTPEIPLDDAPYDVVTSPLGRAYRALLWRQTVHEVEATDPKQATAAQLDAMAAVRAHQAKRSALGQAEIFFRAERQRLAQALHKELATLLAQGQVVTVASHLQARRFRLPEATLSSPPTLDLGALEDQVPADEPARRGETLGGGGGTLADLDRVLAEFAEWKGQLIDDGDVTRAAWESARAT